MQSTTKNNLLTDSHYKAIYESVRSECCSSRVCEEEFMPFDVSNDCVGVVFGKSQNNKFMSPPFGVVYPTMENSGSATEKDE